MIPIANKALLLALNVLISDKEREIEKEKNVLNTQALFVERLQNELTQLKANRDELQNS